MKPEIGKKAPEFKIDVRHTDGTTGHCSLSDFAGKNLVLYFYPKDDTPGCTTQAINFTAHLDAFTSCNAVILGVSADPLTKHEKFANKHDLGIALGSDEDHEMIEAYGSWVEKNMYGRKYMGIERSTFLIGETGEIKHIWRKVKVKTHIEDVLDVLRDS
ncbi:MAG: peroxiredoxin [Parvibaculales bacterium]